MAVAAEQSRGAIQDRVRPFLKTNLTNREIAARIGIDVDQSKKIAQAKQRLKIVHGEELYDSEEQKHEIWSRSHMGLPSPMKGTTPSLDSLIRMSASHLDREPTAQEIIGFSLLASARQAYISTKEPNLAQLYEAHGRKLGKSKTKKKDFLEMVYGLALTSNVGKTREEAVGAGGDPGEFSAKNVIAFWREKDPEAFARYKEDIEFVQNAVEERRQQLAQAMFQDNQGAIIERALNSDQTDVEKLVQGARERISRMSFLSLKNLPPETIISAVTDEAIEQRKQEIRAEHYGSFFEANSSVMLKIAQTLVGRDKAADVVQEAMVKIIQGGYDLQGKKISLRKIISSIAIDMYRHEQVEQRRVEEAAESNDSWVNAGSRYSPSTESVVFKRISHDYLVELVQGEAIILKLADVDSYQELADAEGKPLGTIKGDIFRARKRLKERLRDSKADEETILLYTANIRSFTKPELASVK